MWGRYRRKVVISNWLFLPRIRGGLLSRCRWLRRWLVLHYAQYPLSDSLSADGCHHHRSQRYRYVPSNFLRLARASEMRKTNYRFEKKQREIAKQKKKEAKRCRRTEKTDQSDKEENSKAVV